MWRWTRRIFAGIIVLLAIAAVTDAVYQARIKGNSIGAQPPGKLVDGGGYRLHIWCTGRGSPAVVLDTGLGGTTSDWSRVQPEAAKFTQVCSYDRAGMGYSDAGPRPRTSQRIVRELANLLDGSGVRDPVILVGASVGGWNVRLFATNYEKRVAGLVLVDARHEDQGERLAAVGAPENPPWIAWAARLAPALAHFGAWRLTPFSSRAFVASADELTHGRESAGQVKAARRELAIPLVVVSAGRRRDDGSAGVLDALQQDQVKLSKRSCQVTAKRAGHAIVIGQPEIVVDAIRATLEASRHATGAPECGSITQRAS